jgi:hypothetical protein
MENVDRKKDFLKLRRGYGAILGGSILVMILLSAFGLYIINNQAQSDFHQTVGDVQSEDIDQFQEDVLFDNIITTYDDATGTVKEFTIINKGPKIVTLKHVGVFGEDNKISNPYDKQYYIHNSEDPEDFTFSIQPSEEETFSVVIPGVAPNEVQYIHVVTERGNVIPVRPTGTIYNEYDSGKMALADVIGYVLPNYDSFGWVVRDQNDVDFDIDEFQETWKVPKSKYYAFKVEVEYVPAKDGEILDKDLQLDSITGIYFKDLENPVFVQFYLVSAVEHYDDGEVTGVTLGQLHVDGEVVLEAPFAEDGTLLVDEETGNIAWDKARLYFAVPVAGEDPRNPHSVNLQTNSRLMVNLGIYEDRNIPPELDYAQSFPLIAVEIVP